VPGLLVTYQRLLRYRCSGFAFVPSWEESSEIGNYTTLQTVLGTLIIVSYECYKFDSLINNTIDTGSASQKHKSPLQDIGCIHRHKSQLSLSDTKKSMFYFLQSRPKLDYTF
jgi:hypothetical protein